MQEFLELVQTWGPYLGLPIIIAFITQGLKSIEFFKTSLGLRFVHFIPLLLGFGGGFLLPETTWQAQLLVGGGLGCVSLLLYKFVTVSLASKSALAEKVARKTLA